MAQSISAGLLMYRSRPEGIECYIVHPGGPFWAKKDEGAWSIPKGLIEEVDEDYLKTAQREFTEETGFSVEGPFIDLGEVTLKSRKRVVAWAFAGDIGDALPTSNLFTMEWPPRSGQEKEFPEIDRGGYFPPGEAKLKLNPAQAVFIDRLLAQINP